MGTDRTRLGSLAWLNKAKKKRQRLIFQIPIIKSASFQDIQISEELGVRYWGKVNLHEYEDSSKLKYVIQDLGSRYSNDQVVVFHKYTAEVGVLCLQLHSLIKDLPLFRSQLGPDLLFCSINFDFGVCFEKEEYDDQDRLRWWGGLSL